VPVQRDRSADSLWRYVEFGRGKKYSENQAEHMVDEAETMRAFDDWTDAFASHVAAKGRVKPGEYRAFGYRPPSHLWADIKTKWRGLRMLLGVPVAGSSPAIQKARNLNRDVGIHYKKGEGAKLRD
jgi:hypothetical protein